MEALGVVVDRRWEARWWGMPPEVRWQGMARSGAGPPWAWGGGPPLTGKEGVRTGSGGGGGPRCWERGSCTAVQGGSRRML